MFVHIKRLKGKHIVKFLTFQVTFIFRDPILFKFQTSFGCVCSLHGASC